jgi:hypothetical protein
MHDNKFNEYRIPSGMLIVFLEKALTLIHMETHLDDVSGSFPECFNLPMRSQATSSRPDAAVDRHDLIRFLNC